MPGHMSIDDELSHVAEEAMFLVRGMTEPDYAEVLLRSALRLRERAAPVIRADEDASGVQPEPTGKGDPLPTVPDDPDYVIHWLEMPTPDFTDDQAGQPLEPVPGPPCGGASWSGEPEEYQAQAGLAAVAAGVTIVPWNWVEATCGNSMCLEVSTWSSENRSGSFTPRESACTAVNTPTRETTSCPSPRPERQYGVTY